MLEPKQDDVTNLARIGSWLCNTRYSSVIESTPCTGVSGFRQFKHRRFLEAHMPSNAVFSNLEENFLQDSSIATKFVLNHVFWWLFSHKYWILRQGGLRCRDVKQLKYHAVSYKCTEDKTQTKLTLQNKQKKKLFN